MKNFLSLILLGYCFTCSSSEQFSLLYPPNNLFFGVDQNLSGLTEKDFNEIANKILENYEVVFTEQGKKLEIKNIWKNRGVNARTRLKNGIAEIQVFGGLIRSNHMTIDGLATVICHEVGHHLAGAPREQNGSGFSNEAQSDYFASLKCFRRLFINEDNISKIKDFEVSESVRKKCENSFNNLNEVSLCIRSALAGFSFVKTGQGDVVLPGEEISFEQYDPNIVSSTSDEYPESQCRLDTILNGAICQVDFNEPLDNANPFKGTCHRKSSFTVGARPLCWFSPKDY